MSIPIADQVAEMERQLWIMRENYPRLVREEKIRQEEADQRIARFAAAVESLVRLAKIDAGTGT